MARIIFRGLYAAFPAPLLTDAGVLAYATDLLQLYEWSGIAWIAYHDYPDYQGEKAGLYLQPEWAALTATDINITRVIAALADAASTFATYNVPAGRTLYITHFGWFLYGVALADRPIPQMGYGRVINNTTAVLLALVGGNGGTFSPLLKPIVVPGNNNARAYVHNESGHICSAGVFFGGYQI